MRLGLTSLGMHTSGTHRGRGKNGKGGTMSDLESQQTLVICHHRVVIHKGATLTSRSMSITLSKNFS